MQKSSLYLWIGLLLVVFTGIYSCTKKVNGVDNDKIIETPYSLYFGDTLGAVYNSNDGKTTKSVFQADGYPCRAICTSGENILLIKKFLYYSTNNGINFNLGYTGITSLKKADYRGDSVDLNQSMIIDIPSWSRTYVACDSVNGQDPLGLALSIAHGVSKSWSFDYSYDTVGSAEDTDYSVGQLPLTMVSFTRLADGVVCALGITGTLPTIRMTNTLHYQNYYKVDTASSDAWISSTGGTYGAANNHAGTPLPVAGFFTLGHYNNQLIAIDERGTNGAYYSNDTGRTWIKYPGIPNNVSLLSVCSPFEENCYVGGTGGLYVLNINTGSFQQVTNGLAAGLIVRGITYKENIYKSGNTQKFVYLATNKGIYQSTDGGSNWIMTIPGNYTAIY